LSQNPELAQEIEQQIRASAVTSHNHLISN